MLDVGERHGVKKDRQFYVFRKGEFVGAVEVTKIIDEGMSSAKILEAFTLKQIMEGDEVRSQVE